MPWCLVICRFASRATSGYKSNVRPPENVLSDEFRLAAVLEVLPKNPPADGEFDRLTSLASRLLDVPTVLVSLVTSERQEFTGACGLPGDLATVRGTPLSHSICKLTVVTRQLVIVNDASQDPLTSENPVIDDIGLRAYMGCPLMTSDGQVLGAFCAIDYQPRLWTTREIDALRDFAALAVGQLEAQAKASRIQASFDVAIHDLRSPLSEILMASSLFREQINRIPEHLQPLVHAVEKSTASAINLVETLCQQDRAQSSTSCDDPVDVMNSVCNRLEPAARKKDIGLKVGSGPECSLAVERWVVEQVLENLTSNAVKYSPSRSVIRVGFEKTADAGQFHIHDEGPGFTDDDRKRLFQRYATLSAEPTGGELSTGLGLSIVKRLVDQHGGTIQLISMPGEGAEFRVSFPLSA